MKEIFEARISDSNRLIDGLYENNIPKIEEVYDSIYRHSARLTIPANAILSNRAINDIIYEISAMSEDMSPNPGMKTDIALVLCHRLLK